MKFDSGWQRFQILFFCQLTAITESCPRRRPLEKGCVAYSCSSLGAGRLTELGRNKFKIREIIFDPTLVLSPHVCLLILYRRLQEDFYNWASTGLPGTLQPWGRLIEFNLGGDLIRWVQSFLTDRWVQLQIDNT